MHSAAVTDDLKLLISPVSGLISLVTGAHYIYLADTGYYFDQLNIAIDKSCSGFNFWMLCFLMLSFLSIQSLEKPLHKFLSIIFSFITAYLLTVPINFSRIYASIVVQKLSDSSFPEYHDIMHQAVGIFSNLTFLIIVYLLSIKLFKKLNLDAKLV